MPNPTLPVTEISAFEAPAGLSFVEARSTIQFLDADDNAAFLAHLGVTAALATKVDKPLSDQTLAADFVTTSASIGAVEYIFTPVPVMSGKSYRFEGNLWIKWATAASSGPADIYEPSVEGPLTVDTDFSRFASSVNGSYDANGFGNAIGQVPETLSWVEVKFFGFFKATAFENFNIGINVPGWVSGDVVTIARGAHLRVVRAD